MVREYDIDECNHITCRYYGQGGCMLPGECIYAPIDDDQITYMEEYED